MKSAFFILLGFLLISGSGNLVKSSGNPKDSASACLLCDETPCKCGQLALKDADGKVSLAKLIHLFLKKANAKCVRSEESWECRHCQHTCPKNNVIAKLLRDILSKVNCDKKEEDSIREIIVKLLDPSDCEKKPCQVHCDPRVRQVLKAILKKGVNCNCKDCPPNCHMNPKLCKSKVYKYWFKVSKEAIRREIGNKNWPQSDNQNLCIPEEKEALGAPSGTGDATNKIDEKKKICKCSECCERCKTCQRPDRFICPRYITDECSTGRKTPFPICADCSGCHISPRNSLNHVNLFCGECRAMSWPFVQFTRNGYPYRRDLERRSGLLVRTRFLQVNDFRSTEKQSEKTTTFNPFRPKCNIPKKRKPGLKRDKRK